MGKCDRCDILIKRLNDAVEKKANNDLRELGLTRSQLQLLLTLDVQPDGTLLLKDLEKLLYVTQQTAAGIVMRLEEKGFVGYTGSAEDKRVKLAVLTSEGREACRKAQSCMDSTERRLTSGMTESERQQFSLLLQKAFESFAQRLPVG
jgi:DNA-binding MarR family transcriptional regulator